MGQFGFHENHLELVALQPVLRVPPLQRLPCDDLLGVTGRQDSLGREYTPADHAHEPEDALNPLFAGDHVVDGRSILMDLVEENSWNRIPPQYRIDQFRAISMRRIRVGSRG